MTSRKAAAASHNSETILEAQAPGRLELDLNLQAPQVEAESIYTVIEGICDAAEVYGVPLQELVGGEILVNRRIWVVLQTPHVFLPLSQSITKKTADEISTQQALYVVYECI